MTRVAGAALGLALVVLGCGSVGGRPLVTSAGGVGCFTARTDGLLLADREYGTVLEGGTPVAWPKGFTARWAGSEVEVYDADGHLVAFTGQHYSLDGGFAGAGTGYMTGLPDDFNGFYACGAT
jgi:hypothetical protein